MLNKPNMGGRSVIWLLALGLFVFAAQESARAAGNPQIKVKKLLALVSGPGNPRNSEGDFVQLANGRLLFVYTHYYSGRGRDNDQAFLAGRSSSDGGLTWSDTDTKVLPNEGQMNVMSVSLLRLQNGQIAMVYLRKNSTGDCRPYLRISTDETKTWSEPSRIIPDSEVGYYVVNNDRLIQTTSGRLIVPVAQHAGYEMQDGWSRRGLMSCYISDDGGQSWSRNRESFYAEDPQGLSIESQEPGVVELEDGRLLMFIRTNAGCHYFCHSTDGGESWSKPMPSDLRSPQSPLSIERIPKTGHLLAVWNNNHAENKPESDRRTPLTMAISRDEGRTWVHHRDLETDADGCYCYAAIEYVDDRVLLGYCAGSYSAGSPLSTTQITGVDLSWLYGSD